MRVADQQACLSATSIADDDELLAILGRRRDVGSRSACRIHSAVATSRRPSIAVAACEKGLAAVLAPEVVDVRVDGVDGHGGAALYVTKCRCVLCACRGMDDLVELVAREVECQCVGD